ncbi:MAG: transglutaminase family protein [Hyphomicrobiaceae bacterium]|nr:transglutaminase family protein [Hyphomicrobiaceae bacterium]
MLVSICHVTRYKYAETARYSVQSLRLTPPSFAGQKVLSWKISAPGIEKATRFFDAFSNISHLISITGEHSEIECRAEGLVETEDRAGVVRGLQDFVPIKVFLRETPKTAVNSSIRELAALTSNGSPIDGLHDLMNAIRDRVDYQIGVTGPHTSAAEALAEERGVCQDFAHIFIAAARAAGIPARYVNGYFLSGADEASEAHHAWAEAYVEGLGWVGFDPTNRMCPTDHYVRLAMGLDAVSAAPIRGNRRGGSEEALDVLVEVQQANSQQ